MVSVRSFFNLRSLGYLEFAKRVYRKVIENRCPAHAASMAYYVLFALFPFFIFLMTVLAHLPIQHLLEFVLQRAARMLPDQLLDLLQ